MKGNDHVGFTGTRAGLTEKQERSLTLGLQSLYNHGYRFFHHGDCVGSDAQAATIAKQIGFRTIAHPPINEKHRAFHNSDEVREPKDYLARDRDIVDECQFLVATPHTIQPTLRSGTWYTIRYAHSVRRGYLIINP